MALQELGIEAEPTCGPDSIEHAAFVQPVSTQSVAGTLKDSRVIFDCIELFSGYGNWSRCHADVRLHVHPGVERSAKGRGFGDLTDKSTFQTLARLAYDGAIREWHAGPPCWSFGTLRRPRLRSKQQPAGFNMGDPVTKEQTLLAVRTAFLLILALNSGCFVSCEQPGSSVMFELHAFKVLLALGCRITKFSFCSYGAGFQKPSKWLHNKSWYDNLAGPCSCAYKNRHFTVQGSFTRAAIDLFRERCRPDIVQVYGREPELGEAVSSFSASYPLPLCRLMAIGSKTAHAAAQAGRAEVCFEGAPSSEGASLRQWREDPEWVEDICESIPFRELFRFKFKQPGHINCLECRVYKSWLKHCAKAHPQSRLVGLLDSRVTMGAAAKGRSSSRALSRILKSTLGYILGAGLYPGALHCRSAWNRADGPSRDRPVPGPSKQQPKWLMEFQKGDFHLFDLMVHTSRWTRPVGRWVRLLLLMAGDVERRPGPFSTPQENYKPRGELNMLGGFAQATSLRMRRCLDLFGKWCESNAKLPLEAILEQAESTNLALRGYGLALFREGKPRYLLVYAITAIQQIKPEFRRQLSGAWQVDFKWQMEEPGQCRAVLSAPVLRAILCLALLWKWDHFTGAVALGFGGMLHPNEFLALRRRDLVFPQDSLMLDSHSLYIFVRNPKTARFARRQHVRVDDQSLIDLAYCLFNHLGLEDGIFPASTAVFRRQWNALLDKLGVPRRQCDRGATPGTLRRSGATHEYLRGSEISQIQWRGRWSRVRTLEYYIQEVAAQLFLFNLSPAARETISFLEQHLPVVLRTRFPDGFSVN